MRVLIAGAGGQLGTELTAWLRRHRPEWAVHAYRREEWNVSCRRQTEALVRDLRPDVIVNCAAFTRVDACETRRLTALRVNAAAPALLARAAQAVGARLVHISTDYVFDGQKGSCYVERDVPRPLNVYGWSKLRGEEAVLAAGEGHLVVRTAWLYGPQGPNFARWVLDRLRRGETVAVVRDVIGSPTHTWDLARFLAEVLSTNATGVVHAANAGACSRFTFARTLARLAGLDPEAVRPARAADFPLPAARPPHTPLCSTRVGDLPVTPLRSWQAALAHFVQRIKKEERA